SARQALGAPLAHLPDQFRATQDLIEALPTPVFFKGRDGRYLGVNRAWEEFFAVPRAAIIGSSVADLYPQDPAVAQPHLAMDEHANDLRCIETWCVDDDRIRDFLAASPRETFVPSETGMIRRVLSTGNSVWIADVTERKDFQRSGLAAQAGLRGAFALPVLMGDKVLGAIEFYSREPRQPDRWLLQVTVSVGYQIGQLMARRT